MFFYILSWKFDEEGNAIPMTIEEQRQFSEQISISNGNKQDNIIIQQKEVLKAHTTLGCCKAIDDGNKEEEIKYL